MKTWAEYLKEINLRVKSATPGLWTPCLGSGNNECTAIHFEGNAEHPYGLIVCDLITDYMLEKDNEPALRYKDSNMEFITHSRSDIPRLLKRIEELEGVLYEVALAPYYDSDLRSLNETLKTRAKDVLSKGVKDE